MIGELKEKEIELLSLLGKEGSLHGYAIHDKPYNIMGQTTWEKYKKSLLELKLMEPKGEVPSPKIRGRIRKLYGLTFKGLSYLLYIGNLAPEKAHDARKKSKIGLPQFDDILIPFTSPFSLSAEEANEFIMNVEEENPGIFYGILKEGNPMRTREDLTPIVIFIMAFLVKMATIDLEELQAHSHTSDFFLEHIKTIKDNLAFLQIMINAFQPEWFKDMLHENLKMILPFLDSLE